MKTTKKVISARETVNSTKGKASFDQNGKGSAPKYGRAGAVPNESGLGMNKLEQQKKKS
ncbi:MAG: hypothetical protein V4549_10280 [Bacteroidota bacterium]